MNKALTALLALTLTICAGCSEHKPETIAAIHRDITQVSEVVEGDHTVLRIEMLPSSGYDEASYFFMAASNLRDILADIRQYFPDQAAQQVEFILHAPLTDKYGNKSSNAVIVVPFDMDEIKKINFGNSNFTAWDLLNLSQSVSYPHAAGEKIVRAYCAGKNNAEWANVFCNRSARRNTEPARRETQPDSLPSAADALNYLTRLDAAVKDFDAVQKKGDLSSLARQSRRMIALMDEGRRFGASVFEEPFGYCFSSGIYARGWWSVLVDIATTGKERTPNAEKDAQAIYLEHRKACLDAIADQEKI